MNIIFLTSIIVILHNEMILTQIISLKLNEFQLDTDYPTLFITNNELLSSGIFLNTYKNTSTYALRENQELILKPSQIKENITTDDDNYIIYETYLQLNQYVTTNLTIFIRDYGGCDLSLSYHTTKEYSLIHNLYRNKQISNLKFAFENIGNKNKEYFHIGGIPNNSHLNMKYSGKIKINETLSSWGFYLTSFTYHNNTYNVNLPCIIQSEVNKMFISEYLFYLLKDNVFKNFFSFEHCHSESIMVRYMAKNEWIKCFFSEEQEKETITFRFGNNLYIDITFKDMFEKEYHKSKFTNRNGLFGRDYIIVGNDFLSLFNYSVFDYEQKQIEFYSDITVIVDKYTIITKCLYNIIIILNILCIIINIIAIIIQKI